MQIPVSIVGTDEQFRLSAQDLVKATEGFKCDGSYSDARNALAGIQHSRPGVMLMDLVRIDSSVLECVKRAKALLPLLGVLVVVRDAERRGLLQCLMAGVTGYLIRPVTSVELQAAIRAVARGGIHLCPAAFLDLAKVFIEYSRPTKHELTPRQREVMGCLLLNDQNKEIADKLRLGCGSVHTHLHRIYGKLKVHGRDEAVRKFLGLKQANKARNRV